MSRIVFTRWPWQDGPITRSLGRFGGGWNWSLGIRWSKRTILIDLIFGSIRIQLRKPDHDSP